MENLISYPSYTRYQDLSYVLSASFFSSKKFTLTSFTDKDFKNEQRRSYKTGFTLFKIPAESPRTSFAYCPSPVASIKAIQDDCTSLSLVPSPQETTGTEPQTPQTPTDIPVDTQSSQVGPFKKGPYRKYTLEEKKLAVKHLNSGKDLKSVSKQFGIPRRNLLRWRKNGCERKQGGGRPTDALMENHIYRLIKNNSLMMEREIREQAKKNSTVKNFKASKGWFVKFCKRFGLKPEQLKDIE